MIFSVFKFPKVMCVH